MLVEIHNRFVGRANLKIYFAAPDRKQRLLCMAYKCSTNASPLIRLSDGYEVKPASMTIVASHDRPKNGFALNRNE